MIICIYLLGHTLYFKLDFLWRLSSVSMKKNKKKQSSSVFRIFLIFFFWGRGKKNIYLLFTIMAVV